MANAAESFIPLITSAPFSRPEWELEDDVIVPESELHDRISLLLQELFLAWAARTANGAHVMRNRAVRWDEANPRIGADPDIAILASMPPEGEALRSVRTWLGGHAPPILAIEVVSVNHPWKDYTVQPEKYCANGTEELWVFDPLLEGPKAGGGPFVLQVWTRRSDGGFARVHAGDAPFRSLVLAAWIVTTDGGARLRVADDPEGKALWPTEAEAERAEKERERAEKERERAEKEQAVAERDRALEELAALRAELARRGG